MSVSEKQFPPLLMRFCVILPWTCMREEGT